MLPLKVAVVTVNYALKYKICTFLKAIHMVIESVFKFSKYFTKLAVKPLKVAKDTLINEAQIEPIQFVPH